MLQPSCQYGVYPVRRVLRPLSPCAFICHTLTQSRHRPTRCFVEGGRLAVACSRFRSAARLKVRLFVGRVSSTGAHDPKQLYGASVDLSSPAACPSRARPWDVRVELFLASFHIILLKATNRGIIFRSYRAPCVHGAGGGGLLSGATTELPPRRVPRRTPLCDLNSRTTSLVRQTGSSVRARAARP